MGKKAARSAKTAWTQQDADTTKEFILVKLVPNNVSNAVKADLQSRVTLIVRQNKGSVTRTLGNWWQYDAYSEPTSQKHPNAQTVKVLAKADNKLLGPQIGITVQPVFMWFTLYHKHKPLDKPHAPTQGDYNQAWQYARWKYGISTASLNGIQVSSKGGYGKTVTGTGGVNRYTTLYSGAFTNENICASTLGHENVHGGQPAWMFAPSLPGGRIEVRAELPAYRWEMRNKGLTGLTAEEVTHVQNWIDYLSGKPGATRPQG